MDAKRLKFVLLGFGIVASMALLIWAGLERPGGFSYYVTVTEFVQHPQRGTEGLRVNGKVVEGTIERFPSGEDVTFRMSDGTSALDVRYRGIIPDTFVDAADVVVEGRMGQDGVFEATTLLAKCPSKYEAADGATTASR